jgi:hypothetical protein
VIVVVLMGIDSTAGFTGLRGRPDESMDALIAAHGLFWRSKAVRSDDHTDWCEERAAGCARAESIPLIVWQIETFARNAGAFRLVLRDSQQPRSSLRKG